MRTRFWGILAGWIGAGVVCAQPVGGFRGFLQPENPVYADDSPAAADTLARVPQLVASANQTEAVRALQVLLDTEPDRVVQSKHDAALYVSVRQRVHEVLLESPELLALYRSTRGPTAEARLVAGDVQGVETSYLLTPAGFEAALRTAQLHLEAARFESARLTLEQIESHPDRRGSDGATAATLYGLVARFLDRPEVWDRATRWTQEAGAGAPPPREAAAWPAGAMVPSFDTLGRGAAGMSIADEEIPPRPLWSVGFVDRPSQPDVSRPSSQRGPWIGLWIFPTVAQDLVFINDGVRIRAWDRYTLEPRWDVVPALGGGIDAGAIADAQQRQRMAAARAVDDIASVTVSGRRLYATTGVPYDGQREGDPRIHAIDPQSGRVFWSSHPSTLDPRLAMTAIRGDVLADADSAIVTLRRSVQTQRVISVYLVSLDAENGSLRWMRPVGSAGALTYQRTSGVAEGGVLHQGVVYLSDPIGLYAAIEAATGRPLWVRTIPAIATFGQADRGSPWEANRPVVAGDRVYMLPVGRRELLVLNRHTGAIEAQRPVAPVGDARYLVRVGDMLAIVGSTVAGFVRLDEAATGQIRTTERFGDGGSGGTRGRAIAVDNHLLVPVASGAVVIDPRNAFTSARRLDMLRPGMTIALGDQLIVADDEAVHSYLSWEAADRLLSRRMTEHPDDPRAAVSMAELAYRGGQARRIGPAADQALAAIMRDPISPRNRAARERLFEALLEMVTTAQSPTSTRLEGSANLTLEDLDAIVSRLGRAAGSNEQQVSHLMALGWVRRAQHKPREAIEAYQQILTSPALSQTRWAAAAASSRADVAATRLIRALVDEFGPSVYASFDAEARRELAALPPTAPASEIETLARRYPVSTMAPTLWMRAAEAHTRGSRLSRAQGALFRALSAAEAHRTGGDPTILGEAAGRLITSLRDSGRVVTAAFVLERLSREQPDLILTVRNEPIDRTSLLASLRTAARTTTRIPRIGLDIDGDPQVIEGWALMQPLSRLESPTATEGVMLISTISAEVALWGVSGSLPAGVLPAANAGALTRIWARSYEGRPPILLRHEPSSVYLAWFTSQGASIECIDAIDGSSRWRTPAFQTLFPPEPAFEQRLVNAAGRPIEFDSPVIGPVRVTDLVASVSDDTIVLTQRSGRTAIFAKESGRLIAAFTSAVGAVYDVAVGHGWVAIAGSADPPAADLGPVASPPMVAVHDAATGTQVLALSDLADPVRWIRVVDAQRLLIATDTRVVVAHPRTGDVSWEAVGTGTLATRDGWVHDNRLFLLNQDSLLHFARLDQPPPGRGARDESIDTRDRTDARMLTRACVIGDRVAFSTSRGLVITGPGGEVLGIDSINAPQGMVPPEASESHFVAVEVAPRAYGQMVPVFPMHLLTSRSASLARTHHLALRESPSAVAILDGAVAITSANVTIVYSMPP